MSSNRDGKFTDVGSRGGKSPTSPGNSSLGTGSRSPGERVTFDKFVERKIHQPDPIFSPQYTDRPSSSSGGRPPGQFSPTSPSSNVFSPGGTSSNRYSPNDPMTRPYSPTDPITNRFSPTSPVPSQYSPPSPKTNQYSPAIPMPSPYSPTDPMTNRYSPTSPITSPYSPPSPLSSPGSPSGRSYRQTSHTSPTSNQYIPTAPPLSPISPTGRSNRQTTNPTSNQYIATAPPLSPISPSGRSNRQTTSPTSNQYIATAPPLSPISPSGRSNRQTSPAGPQNYQPSPTGRPSSQSSPNGPASNYFSPGGHASNVHFSESSTRPAGVGGTTRTVESRMKSPAPEDDSPSGRYEPRVGGSPKHDSNLETARYHVSATTNIYVGEPGGSPPQQHTSSTPTAGSPGGQRSPRKGQSPNLSFIQQLDRELTDKLKSHHDEPTERGAKILHDTRPKHHRHSPPPAHDISTLLKSTLSGSEIEQMLRLAPDSALAEAIDMYMQAEDAQMYMGAVQAAEEAAANAPPELREEAAAAGARSFRAKVTDTLYETMMEKTEMGGYIPIEVIGYIGITKPN